MKPLHNLGRWVWLGATLMAGTVAAEQTDATGNTANTPRLSEQVQDLKTAALELNRDLLILEEELLFPTSTRVVAFVSLDVGEGFRLDTVELEIDDQLVASHLYTDRQNDSLSRGGIQRLYVGNLKPGIHEVTAFFTGIGPDGREHERAASTTLEKGPEPQMFELRIEDSTATMQPEFSFKEWQL